MTDKYSPFQPGDIVTFIKSVDRMGVCFEKGSHGMVDRVHFLEDGSGPLTVDVLVNGHTATHVSISQIEHRKTEKPVKANSTQVGGDHYRSMKIQPIEYSLANGLGPCEANVVKYISRHKSKGGAQDLKKAKHFIDLLLQHEYPDETN